MLVKSLFIDFFQLKTGFVSSNVRVKWELNCQWWNEELVVSLAFIVLIQKYSIWVSSAWSFFYEHQNVLSNLQKHYIKHVVPQALPNCKMDILPLDCKQFSSEPILNLCLLITLNWDKLVNRFLSIAYQRWSDLKQVMFWNLCCTLHKLGKYLIEKY